MDADTRYSKGLGFVEWRGGYAIEGRLGLRDIARELGIEARTALTCRMVNGQPVFIVCTTVPCDLDFRVMELPDLEGDSFEMPCHILSGLVQGNRLLLDFADDFVEGLAKKDDPGLDR